MTPPRSDRFEGVIGSKVIINKYEFPQLRVRGIDKLVELKPDPSPSTATQRTRTRTRTR